MKYWVEYDIKTKMWVVYDAHIKIEGAQMRCITKFSIKLFDVIVGAALKILMYKK